MWMRLVLASVVGVAIGCASTGGTQYSESEQTFVDRWKLAAQRVASQYPIEEERLERLRVDAENAEGARQSEALRRLGFNYHGRQLGEWDRAAALLANALEVGPEDSRLLFDAGRALVVAGQRQQGLELLERSGTEEARRFREHFLRN